jgi:Ser/Thr protein kinase RdoA (MazF antagonist)
MSVDLSLVPEPHRDAVVRALNETFCGAPVSAIVPMAGGRSSALVYRVDAEDASYVMRVVVARNLLSDPVRQFAAMQVAANDGVAPPVHFADAESGIAITAFIASRPWHEAFATGTDRIAGLGRCVRRLHDGPALASFLDAFQCIDQGLGVVTAAGAALPPMLVRYLEDFVAVRDALLPHWVLTASHNDLNPGNLLYDGERPWLIDWESAWQNDPMFDVATMLHWFGFAGDREAALLAGYFGGTPTPLQRAKLEVMKQVVSCYYAVIFLLLTLQHGELPPPLDPDPASLPTFADTRASMRDGSLALDSAADRVRFALVMIHDARRAAATPRFAAALELLLATPLP